jgi:hypothetical protein
VYKEAIRQVNEAGFARAPPDRVTLGERLRVLRDNAELRERFLTGPTALNSKRPWQAPTPRPAPAPAASANDAQARLDAIAASKKARRVRKKAKKGPAKGGGAAGATGTAPAHGAKRKPGGDKGRLKRVMSTPAKKHLKWKTPDGKGKCFGYNGEGCGRSDCRFEHLCFACDEGHPFHECQNFQE